MAKSQQDQHVSTTFGLHQGFKKQANQMWTLATSLQQSHDLNNDITGETQTLMKEKMKRKTRTLKQLVDKSKKPPSD